MGNGEARRPQFRMGNGYNLIVKKEENMNLKY